MSQRSQVNWVTFCMSISKIPWVTESVSQWVRQWQGHLLSCSGQLKTHNRNLLVFTCANWCHIEQPWGQLLVSMQVKFITVKQYYRDIFVGWITILFFSCPQQLNRWPCPLVRWSDQTNNQSLHKSTEWPRTLVTFETFGQSLTDSQYFYFWHTKSDPRDFWPLRHLIRVMRKHDLTNIVLFVFNEFH